MPINIPAFCNNKECGLMFPSGFIFDNSFNVSLSGNKSGPCPHCGSMGHVPDGIYNFIGNVIEILSAPERTQKELASLVKIISESSKENQSAERILESIQKELPGLEGLLKIFPQAKNEWYSFIQIILQVAMPFLVQSGGIQNKQAIVFNQTFNNYEISDRIEKAKNYDIYKAGGIIIENKKLLLTKSIGKDIYVAPGGKLEVGESSKEALIRELKEELDIDVLENDLEEFGDFYASAAGSEDKLLRMDVFIVKRYSGKIEANREVEKIAWIYSNISEGLSVGSIFEHEVIPRLKKKGLID